MDIREKIYTRIQEKVEVDYDERTELAKALVDEDRELLIQDLERFYQGWFNTQEEKEYTEERGRREKIQEVCFEVVCEALALSEDPSVIPYFLKYIRPDKRTKGCNFVRMEDYNTQHLIDCILNYYGLDYIPVLLAHIHEMVPEKLVEANSFLGDMIKDTFGCITPEEFPDSLPIVDALALANQEVLVEILKQELTEWQETIKNQKEEIASGKFQEKKLEAELKRLDRYKMGLACTEYVLGQLLLLPKD